MSPPLKYWAFLSYSHADAAQARALARAIETYRLPTRLSADPRRALPKRLFPVFRDRDELPSAADLGAAVEEALRVSRALIVLCSPAARASRWVAKEIETFAALHGSENIYAALLNSEPAEAFPAPLQQRNEPLWADLRVRGARLRDERLRLIAGILGLSFDALKQRDRQRRRARIVRAVAASALAAVCAFGAVLTQRSSPVTMRLAWRTVAPVPTAHRWNDAELFSCPDCYYEKGMAAGEASGRVFLLGGSANVRGFERGISDCFVLSSVHAFDPGLARWTRRRAMSTARSDFGVATVAGVLYAMGGNVAPPTGACVPSAVVEAYDPKSDRWRGSTPMPEPRCCFAAVAVAIGKRSSILVFGGSGPRGRPLQSVYAYDPATNRWSRKRDLPHAIPVVAGALSGGKVYAFGSAGDPPQNAVQAYDPQRDSWGEDPGSVTHSEDYANGAWFPTAYAPGSRAWSSVKVAVVGADVYVLEAGAGDSRSAQGASALDIYRPRTNDWRTAPSLPASPEDVVNLASSGGEVYAYTFAPDLDAHSYVGAWRLTPFWLRW